MARLLPNTLGLTLLLALVTSTNPIGTDMYLPSLPAIRESLQASTAEAQATLSAFLVGAVLAQLVLGPWSDYVGRRPAILLGLVLFVAGSIACALAPSIEVLIGARVLQSFGGAGAAVIGRSMVRDLFSGWKAGKEFARLNSIRGVVPLVCPLLGAALTGWFGWRSNFVAMAVFGLPLIVVVGIALPETLAQKPDKPFSVSGAVADYRDILTTPSFLFYAGLNALVFSGFFAFLSGSAFVMQGLYGMSKTEYALGFSAVVGGYIAGSMIAHRLQARFAPQSLIFGGLAATTLASFAMLCLMVADVGGALAVIVTMALFTTGMGTVMPYCEAGALRPFSDRVGSAASMTSIVNMSVAALFGLAVGQIIDASAMALPAALMGAAAVALALFVRFRSRFA